MIKVVIECSQSVFIPIFEFIWIVVRKFYNVAFSEGKENIQAEMSVSATTLNLDKMVF